MVVVLRKVLAFALAALVFAACSTGGGQAQHTARRPRTPFLSLCPESGPAVPPRTPVTVPDEIGQPLNTALHLVCDGFAIKLTPPNASPAGLVVAESPAPGSMAMTGESVTLTIGSSAGPAGPTPLTRVGR
jgi:hypothetical protein